MQNEDEYGRLCNLPSCGHELRRHQAQEGMCLDCQCHGWVPTLQCTRPPEGWHCNLSEDHDGPCPTWPNDDNNDPSIKPWMRTESWMEQAEMAMRVMRSEPFMWLMVGSGHPEAQLAALRPLWNAYRDAGGKHWGDKNVKGK